MVRIALWRLAVLHGGRAGARRQVLRWHSIRVIGTMVGSADPATVNEGATNVDTMRT
jgi:hypothetical protein